MLAPAICPRQPFLRRVAAIAPTFRDREVHCSQFVYTSRRTAHHSPVTTESSQARSCNTFFERPRVSCATIAMEHGCWHVYPIYTIQRQVSLQCERPQRQYTDEKQLRAGPGCYASSRSSTARPNQELHDCDAPAGAPAHAGVENDDLCMGLLPPGSSTTLITQYLPQRHGTGICSVTLY